MSKHETIKHLYSATTIYMHLKPHEKHMHISISKHANNYNGIHMLYPIQAHIHTDTPSRKSLIKQIINPS